jgi:nitrogen-specific signal transduction histidine kinase
MSDAPPVGDSGLPADALRATLDAVDTPVFVFDGAGDVQFANRVAADLLGSSAAALREASIDHLFGETDDKLVEQAVADVLETGTATVDVSLAATDEGVPVELDLVAIDNSEPDSAFAGVARRHTDEGHAASSDATVLDRMSDAFYTVDEEWRLTYHNEKAGEVLRSAMGDDGDVDSLVGLNLWDEIPEAVDTPFYDYYQEVMRTREPVTFEEFYEPLDTWFRVRVYPSESGFSVYLWDSTQQHRKTEMLEERERILRDIHTVTADTERTFDEQVDDLLDIGRQVVGTSYATLSRIRGEEYEFEAVSADDDSIEAGDTTALAATNCERTAAQQKTLVLSNVAADAPDLTDKTGYEEWGIACYLGAPVLVEGEVYGTFCFYDDEPRAEEFSEWQVTIVDLLSQWLSYELTRQHTQERLQRQNDKLEEFAAIVSHDLRNPLSVLSGYLDLAESDGDPAHFERCRGAVEQMEALIEDLLALSKAGEHIDEQTQTDLATAVDESWQRVDTTDHHLDARVSGTIEADESRLTQLLGNLFRNAVEHGGDTVTVGDLSDGFYVADDGPGIPSSQREAVFEPGHSTVPEGTGFGLNIVKQVADAHGWDVAVTESETGGARFEFTGVEPSA